MPTTTTNVVKNVSTTKLKTNSCSSCERHAKLFTTSTHPYRSSQVTKVAVISLPHEFQSPLKRIHTPEDISHFVETDSANNFVGFIVSLSESICGKRLSEPCHESETLGCICSIMDTLIRWVDEIPHAQQSARYGNYAYRDWSGRLLENAEVLMLNLLPEDLRPSTIELVPFGNWSRIDYGTGHETNFASWLYFLARMKVVDEDDYQGVISKVFVKYLNLIHANNLG